MKGSRKSIKRLKQAREKNKKQNIEKYTSLFEQDYNEIGIEDLFNEISEKHYADLPDLYFEDIIEKIKKFNLDDWILWINAAAIHPKNQLMELRFQLLMGHVLTIEEADFSSHPLRHEDFRTIVNDFSSRCFSLKQLEDFIPQPQLNKIPLFFNGDKKYFFYSSFEQPYLHWRSIIDLLYPALKTNNHFLGRLIEQSLDIQTKLINSVEQNVSDCEIAKNMFVPEECFLDIITPIFKETKKINKLPCLTCGALSKQKNLYIKIINNNFLRDKLYVQTQNNCYLLFPFNHIDVIYRYAEKTFFLKENASILTQINQVVRDYLQKSVYQSCHISKAIKHFIEMPGENILTKDIDAIAELECNKFILFKATPYCKPSKFNEIAQQTIDTLEKTIKSLKESSFLFKKYHNECEPSFQPGEITEFYGVAVLNPIRIESSFGTQKDHDGIFFYHLNDIVAMLDSTDNLKELLNFFKADKAENILCIDALDRFTIYSKNKGFNTSGINPTTVIVPHTGSEYLNEQLYKKYSDNIYYLLYKYFGHRYNKVKYKEYIGYEAYDSISGAGGIALKFCDSLIFLNYPWDVIHNYPEEEISMCSNYMGPLLGYYLNALKALVESLFIKWRITSESLHTIYIIPASTVKRKKVNHLYNAVQELTVDYPIASNTGISNNNEGITHLIFDKNCLFEAQQSDKSNRLEKIIITELLSSMIKFYEQKSVELSFFEAEEIIEKHIPDGPKLHSLDVIHIENPILDSYSRPVLGEDVYLNKVQKQIATFLNKESIEVGTYGDSRAKQICNQIFSFLFHILINNLKNYNEHQVSYIYRQIELLEGEREKIDMKSGLQSQIPTTYDLEADYEKKMGKIRNLAVVTKYIFQISISISDYGEKTLAESEFHELQAIGHWINQISLISDSLHYEISNNILKITDIYELEIIRGKHKFDTLAFSKASNIKSIESNTINIEKQKKEETIDKEKNDNKELKWLSEINEAFCDELGFKFLDLVSVLKSIPHIENDNYQNYPIQWEVKDILAEKIKDVLNSQKPASYFMNIIEYLIIKPLDIMKPILPSQIDSMKNRINLCPFFIKDDKISWGNQISIRSGKLWCSLIGSGIKPYKINNSSKISKSLDKIHKFHDKNLENKTFQIAKNTLGEECCEKNINNFRRISASFPKRPDCGEIDVLAIAPSSKIIYVIDAKNANRGRLYSEISREHNKFFAPKGYYYHLSNKANFVKDNIDTFLDYFSIQNKSGWEVKKAFVVKDNYVSAFHKDNLVDFVLLNELEEYLS